MEQMMDMEFLRIKNCSPILLNSTGISHANSHCGNLATLFRNSYKSGRSRSHYQVSGSH